MEKKNEKEKKNGVKNVKLIIRKKISKEWNKTFFFNSPQAGKKINKWRSGKTPDAREKCKCRKRKEELGRKRKRKENYRS